MDDLVAAVVAGSTPAIARALSAVENGDADAEQLVAALHAKSGRARTVGFTGAPGVGKSTLVRAVGLELLRRGARVAVLAVDPTSPFSGGALLGDRLRMTEIASNGGFIRSMATRGNLGGLAAATADAADVLDAAGFDWILVETVGVGQDEVDVAAEVDTVVVVTMAGLGDDVQAAKAGLFEIANIFDVNKADLPGADVQVTALAEMLELRPRDGWVPPVIRTSALAGDGLDQLVSAILLHHDFLDRGSRAELRRRRTVRRVERALGAMVWQRLRTLHEKAFTSVIDGVRAGEVDPYAAARKLLATLSGGHDG